MADLQSATVGSSPERVLRKIAENAKNVDSLSADVAFTVSIVVSSARPVGHQP